MVSRAPPPSDAVILLREIRDLCREISGRIEFKAVMMESIEPPLELERGSVEARLEEFGKRIAALEAQQAGSSDVSGQAPIGILPAETSALMAELAEYDAEDEQIAATPVEVPPERLWGPRLSLYRQQKMWLAEWGPRPGQLGCECPDWLL